MPTSQKSHIYIYYLGISTHFFFVFLDLVGFCNYEDISDSASGNHYKVKRHSKADTVVLLGLLDNHNKF